MLNLNFQVSCEFRCEPIYSTEGKLYAVEVLTMFTGGFSGGKLEPQNFISLLDAKSKHTLLSSQLQAISRKASFFRAYNIFCSLNIDQAMALMILEDNEINDIIKENEYIRLEISERFPRIDKVNGNIILNELSRTYKLWLDDYGVDFSNINTLKNSQFESVKIDKKFFWENGTSVMWPATMSEIRKYCSKIIVEGVETASQFRSLTNTGIYGVQGFLFPAVLLTKIENLLPARENLN